jgi:hypothetical protein
MSLSQVYRVHCGAATVIAKGPARPTEVAFYRQVAPRLADAGIALPAVLGIIDLPAESWLLLEDLPAPTSPHALTPVSPPKVDALARLHSVTQSWTRALPSPAVPVWTEAVTATALRFFSVAIASALGPLLQALQRRSGHLSAPWCWISGDPNAQNWGERADGTLVLFDWELFRWGVPATDLAIVIAGLGDAATYQAVATRYCAVWPASAATLPWTATELARDIALAKVWTVVDFLGLVSAGLSRPSEGLLPRLIEIAPPWVEQVSAMLSST